MNRHPSPVSGRRVLPAGAGAAHSPQPYAGLRRARNEPAARREVRAVHQLFTVSQPSRTQLPW
ncbi:hypothetical protein [Streptomyces decoyicus]